MLNFKTKVSVSDLPRAHKLHVRTLRKHPVLPPAASAKTEHPVSFRDTIPRGRYQRRRQDFGFEHLGGLAIPKTAMLC